MNHRVRWHLGALASVVALLASLASLDAQALALGRVTVQSALGEPLRAEIDIPEITTDETASLRAGVANADAFKAAGLEYTPAVIGVQVSLQKRPDGRSYLRLSSSHPVAEPFVDLVLEVSWSSGRIMRDYTMLFDPPSLRSGSAGGAEPITAAVAPTPAPTRAAPQESRAKARASAPAGEKQVAVKSGDTAGKIAAQNKPASVSLDQMLVALLKSNPDAFIGGNVNRLKAGSVLEIPAANDAAAISPADASRIIIAQSTDFNDFRRKLAEGVPTGSASRRQAAGKVQAKVEDRAAPAAAPDKLTLSKGAVPGKAAAEEKIAQDRQAKDASTRVAELTKNIADLNKLTGSPADSGAAPAAASAAASSGVAKKPAAAPPPPPPEPSLIDELMDNPYVLPGAGGLLLLLGAFGFYRYKNKRNDAAQVDGSFLESRLQPDSFFGASGGQRIDTSESGATGSSLVYSPSQLDAVGDVDPVAEADVYLAYGRDLQAEEILKEAMHTSPTRVAIHAKLMEIYAKRRDIKAFEVVATQAFNLTHGQGPEWATISELGRNLDPGNPMYQPDGQPHAAVKASEENAQDEASTAFGSSTILQMRTAHPEVAAAPMDFDLNLDFSIGDEPAVTAAPIPAPPVATAPPPAPPAAPVVAALDSGMLEFDLSSLSLDLGDPTTASPSLAASGTSALSVSGDPLETKFALAEEFRTLGDTDGARSLAEEVAAQAKGLLKSKAQSFLASLS